MAARAIDPRPWQRPPRPALQRGFTYIGLLVVVVIMGIALVKVSDVWVTVAKRQKEEQLLWVGAQYRQALLRYYVAGLGERYPHKLEDLLLDPRTPNVRRYLRQLYPDPVTGRAEWGLTKVGDLITGVYSLSDDEPLKKAEFDQADAAFADKDKYSDWVFAPKLARGPAFIPAPQSPAASGAPPGAAQAPGSTSTQQQNTAPGGSSSPAAPAFRFTPGLSR